MIKTLPHINWDAAYEIMLRIPSGSIFSGSLYSDAPIPNYKKVGAESFHGLSLETKLSIAQYYDYFSGFVNGTNYSITLTLPSSKITFKGSDFTKLIRNLSERGTNYGA